jgi:hypothetical protein
MSRTKQVQCVVVQWLDDDEPRIEILGWSDCDHQIDLKRERILEQLGAEEVKRIQAIRTAYIEVPVLEDLPPLQLNASPSPQVANPAVARNELLEAISSAMYADGETETLSWLRGFVEGF